MERFWSKVQKTADCWIWTAYKNRQGYGYFGLEGKVKRAHKVAYEWAKGPVPKGLELDHLCRNKGCVNPDHLEAVTSKINSIRAVPYSSRFNQIHCKYGHPFDSVNTGFSKRKNNKPPTRRCLKCHRDAEKHRRDRTRR